MTATDPQTNLVVPLFHPRRDTWDDHFDLASDGTLSGTTPAGRTTIRLLQLNRPERIEERQLLIAAKLWTHPTDG